ncbi:PhoX family phosphatase [Modestobacter sp. VKM Ac-2979]|uniref:PhoX family protein n=1 Tax=unclassified Modestobacter TaxID=2643866 RepID=UPI0022AB5833|nr:MULTISPECIES: PhoX family phosphatase [unclassified Modestobacter]MCZ2810334.1 PhoX family phosphatase [Modestobacter sp. VKM Ac-2979]MCZ2841820.1 PhoX family phosphatase [Modestobacter sp. VKM Ac-2980]
MTDIAPTRRRLLLPLLDSFRHGSRTHTTCHYKCGNACDVPVPNKSDNPTIGEVVESAFSRRTLLKAAGAGALVVAAGPLRTTPALATGGPGGGWQPHPEAPLTFEPVEQNFLDELVTATGYEYAVVLRWGDPVEPGAPEFDVDNQTPEAQAKQFGYNCDYIGVLPLDRSGRRALIVVNHEYTNEQLMFAGVADEDAPTTDQQKRIAMMAHGLSVVELHRDGDSGNWRPDPRGKRNRRLTPATTFELTGPAAGSEYVQTNADPAGRHVLGTLNNCAGGTTPWGTTLHGEENFNQYFGPSTPFAEDPREPRWSRYGISTEEPGGRRWDQVDSRFDVTQEPNEPNRFGYIVELDPYDPTSTPKKRTALGRFKHEGANVRIAEDGRVVAYSGDDERFDYIYKFVSKKRYRPGFDRASRAHNMTLLEEGDLYVGRFTGDSPPEQIDGLATLPADGEFDGTGQWLPLVKDGQSMIPGKSVPWVLTFTRLAADRLGKQLDANGDFPDPAAPVVVDPSQLPTRMDRPEDIQVNPVNGRVYAALTNNSQREVADEANPVSRSFAFDLEDGTYELRDGNRNGHVLEWLETDGIAGDDFYWRVFIVAGDPETPGTYFAGYDKTQVSALSCPDNLEFDPAGNLWISTDGTVLSTRNREVGTYAGTNDGLFAVPTAGPERGHLKAFLTVPIGAECSGPLITPDVRSVFVAVQHPGETPGSTREAPSSTWPDRLAERPYPRPSVAVVFRPDGGRIGS